jgi:hypothetical protein
MCVELAHHGFKGSSKTLQHVFTPFGLPWTKPRITTCLNPKKASFRLGKNLFGNNFYSQQLDLHRRLAVDLDLISMLH